MYAATNLVLKWGIKYIHIYNESTSDVISIHFSQLDNIYAQSL